MNNLMSREHILNSMLLSINDPKYLIYFPVQFQDHFSKLGYTAVENQESVIRNLLEGLANAVYLEQFKE